VGQKIDTYGVIIIFFEIFKKNIKKLISPEVLVFQPHSKGPKYFMGAVL